LTLFLRSKTSGGANLRVSRGFGRNTRFGGAAAPPYQGQCQDAPAGSSITSIFVSFRVISWFQLRFLAESIQLEPEINHR
jgi:hypothetical protein